MLKTIALFTDYGLKGPYIGQVKSILAEYCVIDLMHDAPKFNPRAASYLLAAISKYLPQDAVVIAVVDPGVGSSRKAVALQAGERWFVGPDNGLLDVVASQADHQAWYEMAGISRSISATFHGRDIFAPMAKRLIDSNGIDDSFQLLATEKQAVPMILAEIIYVDSFGNLMTGLRYDSTCRDEYISTLEYKGVTLSRHHTFSDVPKNSPFFYSNSQGLIEIAVNCGSAEKHFDAAIGDTVTIAG